MKSLVFFLLLLSFPALAEAPQPFGRGSWQQLRGQHTGRPLIVHFWGVTCAPCLAELPRWGEFIREKPGVDIVLVAADPVMADQNTVAGALAKAGCGAAENWIFADPFTERLTYEVDPNWGGELPYSLLVGTDASVTAILGEVNFSELRVWSARQGKSATGGR